MKMRNVNSSASLPGAPGDFVISIYADGNGLLRMACPNGKKICGVAITRGPENPETHHHGWDGNMEAPTITPSIGCDHAPRCGWHGHIIAGIRTPD